MKDTEANTALIKHINKRIEQFLDDYDPTNFASITELQFAFARWLRRKEKDIFPPKNVNGVIGQQVDPEDVQDEHSHTLAFVKMFNDGKVGVMWSPLPFTAAPMPDELREVLVHTLRFHADRLADKSLDKEMQRINGGWTGAA